MKFINLVVFLILGLILTACSSMSTPREKFTFFHHQADFDIAKISHYNIAIVGLIDDTQTLTPIEKEQFTYAVYQAFVNEVEDDNLFQTEELVANIGIKNYQTLYAAAKINDTANIAQVMSIPQASKANSRYLLILRLTELRDLHKEGGFDNNFFFSSNSCGASGWALGLTMTIIDTQTESEVWGGHLNKKDKQEYCQDDDDYFYDNSHHARESGDKNSFLIGLFVLLAVAVIADEISDNDHEEGAMNNDKLSLFKNAVNDFRKELPTFYFN